MKLSAEHKQAKELIQQIADLIDTSPVDHSLKQKSITATRSGLLELGVIFMNYGYDNLKHSKLNKIAEFSSEDMELLHDLSDEFSEVSIEAVYCSHTPEKHKPRHDSILDRIFMWTAMPILFLMIIFFVLFFTYQGIDFIIQGIISLFQ